MSEPDDELRAMLANVIRAHMLENGRCIACGKTAVYQSLHQADALLALSNISIRRLAAANADGRWGEA